MPTLKLTPEQFQRINRAIADPNRYEMLRQVFACKDKDKDPTCGSVISALSISPGTASHHLHELEAADLIHVTKAGRYKKLAPRRDIWRAYLTQLRQL
jgi:ArsR family transcriptional regulator, arsenate/arsenite/antimonite-responsive transcriptional repressor